MPAVLNRAMFARRAWDSAELTVLATVVHVFEEPGEYELFVRRGGQLVQRAAVLVGAAGAPRQVDVDLAALPAGHDSGCGCEARDRYELAEHGAIVLYVRRGAAAFAVALTRGSERGKESVLDTTEAIAGGDVFALALVREGVYDVRDDVSGARARIVVALPRRERYRLDEPAVIEVADGFRPDAFETLAGRTVAFHCRGPARIRVQLTEEPKPS
jgi:hypothetical protein